MNAKNKKIIYYHIILTLMSIFLGFLFTLNNMIIDIKTLIFYICDVFFFIMMVIFLNFQLNLEYKNKGKKNERKNKK